MRKVFVFVYTVSIVLLPPFIYAQEKGQIIDRYTIIDQQREKEIDSAFIHIQYIKRAYDNFIPESRIMIREKDSMLKLLKTMKNDTDKIELLRQIGKAYDRMRLYPSVVKALEYFNKELQLSEQLKYKHGIFRSCISIGSIYFRWGNYPEAEKYYLMALPTKREFSTLFEFSTCYLGLGDIYKKQNNYVKALQYYDSCLYIVPEECKDTADYTFERKLLSRNATNEQLFIAFRSIGEVYKIQRNYPVAFKYLQSALDYSRKLPWSKKYGDAYTLIGMGDIYQLEGNYDEAKKYYLLSLQRAIKPSAKDLFASIDFKLGALYICKKNYPVAKAYLEKGLIVAKETGDRNIISECYEKFAQLYAETNNYKKAYTYNMLYVSLKDSIMNFDTSSRLAQMQLQFDFDKKQEEIKAEQEKKNAIMEVTLKRQHFAYIAFAVIVILFALVAILLFNRYKLRERLERQMAIAEDRRRISAEIHDDLGAGLTKISLLSEIAKRSIPGEKFQSYMESISKSSNELVDKMGEIVWAINAKNDNIESLFFYIRRYAIEFFSATEMQCKVNMPENIPFAILEGEMRRSIFLIVKESLHNAVKHSKGDLVIISFNAQEKRINITISDNGIGINLGSISKTGNGLVNMKKRINDVKGKFDIKNQNGTIIEFSFPLP